MKLKKTSLLLVIALCSCANGNVPEEINSFLNGCSLKKAKEQIHSIDYRYESHTFDKEGEVGSSSMHVLYDRKEDDFYKYQVEDYTGSSILKYDGYDVMKQEIFTYPLEDKYVVDTYQYRRLDDASSLEKVKYSSVSYFKENSEELIYSIFSSKTQGIGNSGGLYYGDFFADIRSYYPYMKVEDDVLVYTLENYPYKSQTEQGYINEVIKMDSLGMILSLEQNAKNSTTGMSTTLSLKADYNGEIQRVERP